MNHKTQPILLSDEQIREFIVNGYVVLQPSVPESLHETICTKLTKVLSEVGNPGNNVLPRVPEMRHILSTPEVQGALISILGEDYIEHPHRYCHHLGPASEPPADLEERVKANCHQDAYTPSGRPRQYYLRYARVMYYPQDTPIALGPTHVIPGTQFNKGLTDEDRGRALPVAGKAGTVSLTHFDIGHAAGVNTVNQQRHMIKFIYTRGSEPKAPSWDCGNTVWQKPHNIQSPYDLELAWSHVWDWMCGKRNRYESAQGNGGTSTNGNLAQLIANLDSDDHAVRVSALYTLGLIGEPAIEPLMGKLQEAGAREDEHPAPRPWNEGAILMEDAAHALAAVGTPAVAPLVNALNAPSEWVRINAAFALGEMDSHATNAVPALAKCLDDSSHRVIRTATDSLGCIQQNLDACIPNLSRLLVEHRAGWNEVLTRGWIVQDGVRTNAAMALARLGANATQATDALLQALDDPCGHVSAFAMDALKRINSPQATDGMLEYLQAQRWDESINKNRQY